MLEKWSDPAERGRMLERIGSGLRRPEARRKLREARLQTWRDEAFRARMAAAKAHLRVQWTPEMTATLIGLRRRGVTIVGCAYWVGVSIGVCRRKLVELGLHVPRRKRRRK